MIVLFKKICCTTSLIFLFKVFVSKKNSGLISEHMSFKYFIWQKWAQSCSSNFIIFDQSMLSYVTSKTNFNQFFGRRNGQKLIAWWSNKLSNNTYTKKERMNKHSTYNHRYREQKERTVEQYDRSTLTEWENIQTQHTYTRRVNKIKYWNKRLITKQHTIKIQNTHASTERDNEQTQTKESIRTNSALPKERLDTQQHSTSKWYNKRPALHTERKN